MITIKNLMTIERILLEIYAKYKFELSFNANYNLYKYLKEIGSITNYSFQVQDEYSRTTNYVNEMKAFHEKVLNGEVDYDWTKVAEFIGEIMGELKNDEVNEMVNKLKFW